MIKRQMLCVVPTLMLVSCSLIYRGYVSLQSGTSQRVSAPAFSNVTRLTAHRSTQPFPETLTTAVVLATYQRSGSSLTGDILQQSPGAFYVYEPLWQLHRGRTIPRRLTYINGTSRRTNMDYITMATSIIRNWINCDIANIAVQLLTQNFMDMGKLTKKFRVCLRSRRRRLTLRDTFNACAQVLQTDCRTSKIRIVKTIRLGLASLEPLLQEVPGLKLVHLVRDPRATLHSQSLLGKAKGTSTCDKRFGGVSGCTSRHCDYVERDMKAFNSMHARFPSRIKRVYYEHIASSPLQSAKDLFKFIGASFTIEAEEYIFNITSAGLKNNCDICTTRSNSSEHADSWKRDISPDFLEVIQTTCSSVISDLGYNIFKKNTANSTQHSNLET